MKKFIKSCFSRPNLGYVTPEPSVYEIVYMYYRTHFTEFEARTLTTQYFEALFNHEVTNPVQ